MTLKKKPFLPKKAISREQQTKKLIWSVKKADDEFSKWIRARDGKCMRCGTTRNLTCSHFWSRQHKGTRFDPNNCVAVCWMPCHKYHWEKEKQGAYMDFMLKWLGEEEYNAVKKRAASIYPVSDAIIDCMKLLEKQNPRTPMPRPPVGFNQLSAKEQREFLSRPVKK